MSLEAQEGRIRVWAAATGAEVVGIVRGGGVSGSKPLGKRPGGAEILELLRARRPEADAVIVMRLDRLGRDAAETLALLKRFTFGKVGLVSVGDHLDLGSPQGRAMAAMVCVFAEPERGLIGQRVSDALQEKKRQMRVYGNLPFGWDRDGDLLVRNRKEQHTLRMMYCMHRTGMGSREIAERLSRARRPTKRGGSWDHSSVNSILTTSSSLTGELLLVDRGSAAAPRRPDGRLIRRGRPYGWVSTAAGRVPVHSEQRTLRRVRDLRAADTGYKRIAQILEAEGHSTKRGGNWDHSTVRSILRTTSDLNLAADA